MLAGKVGKGSFTIFAAIPERVCRFEEPVLETTHSTERAALRYRVAAGSSLVLRLASNRLSDCSWFEEPLDGRKDVPLVEGVDIEEWRRQHGWYDREEAGDSDDQRGCECGEEEEEEEQEEEEEELEQVNEWNYMDARPAGNVLRDMIRWYRELFEVPGCSCDQEDGWEGREDWLYTANMGGRGRASTAVPLAWTECVPKLKATSIKHYDQEDSLSKLKSLKRQVKDHGKDNKSTALQRQQKLAAAETLKAHPSPSRQSGVGSRHASPPTCIYMQP